MAKWGILFYGLGISGGANVIYEHALYALEQGNEITFISKEKRSAKDAAWHLGTEQFLYKTLEEVSETQFDVAIATGWNTSFDIYLIHAKKYIYFVQSIESRFFQDINGMLPYVANMSYEMDMNYITEATWIKNYLYQIYGVNAKLVLNGMDKEKFKISGDTKEIKTDKRRVLVEGSVYNWLKNVPRTIELCREAGAEEVWLVTPDEVETFEGVDRVFCKVPFQDMPSIYRSCDILVKLSLVEGMFGPPLEMFHCGGTVVTYDIEGSEEYLINEYNALVVPKGDENTVVEAIRRLLTDGDFLAQLKKNAQKTADNWITWNESSKRFYHAVQEFPEVNELQHERILQKGKWGRNAIQLVEHTVGIEPKNHRIEKTVAILQRTDKKLLIYGAGLFARGCICAFSNYDVEIEAIVVSDVNENPRVVLGHSVKGINEYLNSKEDYIIYISSDRYFTEIREQLINLGFENFV